MLMREMRLTDDHVDRLRGIARRSEGWPLESRQTLNDLQGDFEGDEHLRALGSSIRAAIAAASLVVLHGAPTDSDAAVVALFQAVAVPSAVGNGDGIVHTVTPKATVKRADLSDTDSEFPPHTDSTFLRDPHHYIALACVERDTDAGGESYVLREDAVRGAVHDRLGPEVLQALTEPAYPFFLQDPLYGDGVQIVPILGQSNGVRSIRYRRDVLEKLLPEHHQRCPQRNRDALAALDRLLTTMSWQERFILTPGDVLIFDNRRVLHGRTPITPGAVRVLRRLKGFAVTGPGFEILTKTTERSADGPPAERGP